MSIEIKEVLTKDNLSHESIIIDEDGEIKDDDEEDVLTTDKEVEKKNHIDRQQA